MKKNALLKVFSSVLCVAMLSACSDEQGEDNVNPGKTEFSVLPETFDLSFEAASPEVYHFTVQTTSDEWEVIPNDDWCVVDKNQEGFSLTVKPSVSFEGRSGGTVTVKSGNAEPVTLTLAQKGLQVCMAGNEDNRSVYWLNGEKHVALDMDMSYLTAIHVTASGDVHAVGRAGTYPSYGFYWNNTDGEVFLNTHSDSSGNTFDVFVDETENSVYFTSHEGWQDSNSGGQTYVASYWKDMVQVPLTEEGKVSSIGSIEIYNGDLYTYVQEGSENYYLKNNEKHMLETAGDAIYTSCMVIRNGDVYIGGYYLDVDKFCPCYWVNGKITTLPTSVTSQVYSIDADAAGNVFLGGSEGSGLTRCAAYWKNGELVKLTDYNNACVSYIRIIGENLFVAGFEANEQNKLVVKQWINNVETAITDGTTSCAIEDVFVR